MWTDRQLTLLTLDRQSERGEKLRRRRSMQFMSIASLTQVNGLSKNRQVGVVRTRTSANHACGFVVAIVDELGRGDEH